MEDGNATRNSERRERQRQAVRRWQERNYIPHPREKAIYSEVDLGANYSADETEFMLAIDRYKRKNQRPFPTWCEVLMVAKSLGYRKEERK